MGEMIDIDSNGATVSGYLATPEGGSGSGPGVVVIQEWWGLVPHVKDVCDRFADEGFVALAPDLYHGEATTEPDEAGKLMMSLNLERAAKDLGGAVTEVNRHSSGDSVGVVGFCMGGGLALWLATLNPDQVKACVPFYGVIPWEAAQPDYGRLEAAVQGHYGTADGFLPVEAVQALEQQLRDLGKDVEIHFYEGLDHAFFNDTRPEVHDAEASQTAWSRTIDFLRRTLGG